MALIKCPECKKKVSDQTNKCPNCGRTITDADKELAIEQNKKSKKHKKIALIVIIVMLLAGVAGGVIYYFVQENNKRIEKEQKYKNARKESAENRNKRSEFGETVSSVLTNSTKLYYELYSIENSIEKTWYNCAMEIDDEETNKWTQKNGYFQDVSESISDCVYELMDDEYQSIFDRFRESTYKYNREIKNTTFKNEFSDLISETTNLINNINRYSEKVTMVNGTYEDFSEKMKELSDKISDELFNIRSILDKIKY